MLQGLAAYQQYKQQHPTPRRVGLLESLNEGVQGGIQAYDAMSQLQMRAQQMKMQQAQVINQSIQNASEYGRDAEAYPEAVNIIAKETFLNKKKPEEVIEFRKSRIREEKFNLFNNKELTSEQKQPQYDKLDEELKLYDEASKDKGFLGMVQREAARQAANKMAQDVFNMGVEKAGKDGGGIEKQINPNVKFKMANEAMDRYIGPIRKYMVGNNWDVLQKLAQKDFNIETGDFPSDSSFVKKLNEIFRVKRTFQDWYKSIEDFSNESFVGKTDDEKISILNNAIASQVPEKYQQQILKNIVKKFNLNVDIEEVK